MATIGAERISDTQWFDIGADAYFDKEGQTEISGLLAIMRHLDRQKN